MDVGRNLLTILVRKFGGRRASWFGLWMLSVLNDRLELWQDLRMVFQTRSIYIIYVTSVKRFDGRERDRIRTIVCSQTPYSVSQNLTVESNPQLYAFFFSPLLYAVLVFPVGANNTFDTLAV